MKKLSKRLMSGVLALLMVVAPMSPYNVLNNGVVITEAAETYTDSQGVIWEYTSDGTAITITGISNADSLTSVEIPSKINNVPVTSIGSRAFGYCTGLTNITIPDSVTSIGNYAFINCSKLASITIPDKVIVINEGVFENCSSLKEIIIPDNLNYIDQEAFKGCASLKSFVIPDGIQCIGFYVFDDCTELSSIVIPDSVTSITAGSFVRCNLLKIYSSPTAYARTYAIQNEIPYGTVLTPEDVTVEFEESIYDGTEKTPSATITYNEEVLDSDQYDISYSNNIFVGKEAVAKITFKDDYYGEIETNFEIKKGNSNLSVNNFGTKTYGDEDFNLSINKPDGVDLDFKSNNENIVTVNENGLVSIKGAGETTITVSIDESVASNYETSSIEVPIKINKKAAFLEITNEFDEIFYDGTLTIETNYEGETDLVFESSDDTIAVVDENGLVTATGKKVGDVRIIVTSPESDNYNLAQYHINLKVKGNMSFTKQPENLKIRLNNDAAFKVETDGFITSYQWYTSTNGLTNGTAITGANESAYTIPSNQLNYDMNGIYFYCIASNGYDNDIISNIVKLTIEEKPTTPKFSLNIQHENWITQEVQISLIGSTIDNASDDVAYKYSINGGIEWIDYENEITWNTDTKESTILAKAYNTLYPGIESDTNAFVLKFDSTAPKIDVVNVDNNNVSVVASDEISGVAAYGISSSNSSSGVTSWTTNSIFEVKENGEYFAFVKDNAGNISASKTFTINVKEATDVEEPNIGKPDNEKPNTDEPIIIKPGKVKGFKQVAYAENYIKLSWTKVAGADGYEVYRATSKKGKYKKVKTIAKTSFKNTKLNAGKNYFYKVKAYKVVNGSKVYGEYSSIIAAGTKSKAPVMQARLSSKGKVKLSWRKSSGASGYEIYIKQGNGKYKEYKTVGSKTLKLTVKGLKKNTKCSFKIRSYRKVNNKKIYSAFSKVKTVRVR